MDDNKLTELSSDFSWATAAFMAKLSEKCYDSEGPFKDAILPISNKSWEIKFFDFNSDKNGVEYQKMLLTAKRQNNKKENVI